MKIILTTGCPSSGYQEVFDSLICAGAVAPRAGGKTGYTPQALQGLILRSHEIDLRQSPALEQLRPGQLWHEPAADLFLTNIEAPLWGWADEQTVLLMDFWQEFDPQVRLLLVYSTPAQHLIEQFRLADGKEVDVQACLSEWTAWNNALLRYHLRHPQRTLLVNEKIAQAEPQKLRDLLRDTWGIGGLREVPMAPSRDTPESTLSLAARGLVATNQEVSTLEQQLHDSSQLPGPDVAEASPDAVANWAAACVMIAKVRGQAQDHAKVADALRGENEKLQKELRKAQERLAHTQTEAQVQIEESARLKAEHEAHKATTSAMITTMRGQAQDHAKVADALRGENEKLQTELRKAQEQLDQHAARHQESKRLADQLETSLAHAHTEVKVQIEESARLKAEHEAHKATLQTADGSVATGADTLAQVEELAQENELVRLQLSQVQEELAYYFAKNQELQSTNQAEASGFLAEFWRTHQPDAIVLDLRRPIVGDQWYDAEVDGRWTGPGDVSSLDLPSLRAGTYFLELDVMDAMGPGILLEAFVEVQGRSLPLAVEYLGGQAELPAICSTSLFIDAGTGGPLQIALRVPHTVCPADNGESDTRALGLRVQQVRLTRQANGGEADGAL
jgi:hypothetical protein